MERPKNTHFLKILPKWYEDVLNGKKKFELRRADRDFKVGDLLVLREYWKGKYTGRYTTKEIQYIYHGDGTYGLSAEFCILGILPCSATIRNIEKLMEAYNDDLRND